MSLTALLPVIANTVSNWVGGMTEATKTKAAAVAENMKARAGSFGEVYLLVIWSYPFVSLFVPGLAEYTYNGFEQISNLPEWYANGFITISFTWFGVSKVQNWVRGK